MKVIGRVIVFVVLPVTVGCGLLHVMKSRQVAENETGVPSTNESTPQPKESREVSTPPKRVVGIDHYRRVSSPLPQALKGLEAELGAGILVAPKRQLILWGKNETKPMPIASMTKMMTLLVSLERMEESPDLDFDTVIRVPKSAERTGGRRVWLAAGHTYTAEKLMKTSIMYSANDASHAIAVGLAPDHDVKKFLVMMNRRARTLGMKRALFFNVHGMPEERDNQATPRDLVVLAMELQKYPKALAWARIQRDKFVHNNGKVVDLKNTNIALLTQCRGVTGLKTGYTDRAGSCITATCVRDGEFLVAVTCGFHTRKVGIKGKHKRTKFVSGLFDWGYDILRAVDQQGGR